MATSGRLRSGGWRALCAVLAAGAAAPALAEVVFVALLRPAGLPPDDAYLRAAQEHHSSNAQVVALTRVDSLAALHSWLTRQAEAHGVPDQIVLVGHGSAWSGATIDLYADGPRATVSSMREARRTGAFPPLPEGVIGPNTRWHLDSCAVGRQHAWIKAFGALWRSDTPVPVLAERDFVFYQQQLNASGQIDSQRYTSAVQLTVHARPGPAAPTRTVVQDPKLCAPLSAPCERRTLPIRMRYRPPAGSSLPQRGLRDIDDPALDAALLDVNLRARQLRWREEHSAGREVFWIGEATAQLLLPADSRWQAPDLTVADPP